MQISMWFVYVKPTVESKQEQQLHHVPGATESSENMWVLCILDTQNCGFTPFFFCTDVQLTERILPLKLLFHASSSL